ncbi:hypothetical protein SNE25_20945 [Mucilaginibacter sabulilitoris]|uniref:Uncharacterized protein n=1 Tax=Mucilaginibacter sabulilitoris TaxID=1173583 RepID=A0ABZ0THU7_9SPHI|nr:hypothetical protein [Mucilaginibacter sabulilitoris]WPU91788.1 hypothetical protein SNE25_20945 [Mucilaginibacter sabulilitoris]
MKLLNYKITGTSALLMHSDATANPLNPFTKKLKEVTKKRSKTDDDHALMSEIEFEASLYHDSEIGYYIPSANLDASFLASAKMFKMGTLWKQAALIPNDAKFVFKHHKMSPSDLYKSGLYSDMRTVKIGTSKTIRTRPIFKEWEIEVEVMLDEAKLNESEVDQIVNNAGLYVGLCDYRPRYGRFSVEKI